MEPLTFRVGDPNSDDYDRFADLVNAAEDTSSNADVLRSVDANSLKDRVSIRYAAYLDENIIGCGLIQKSTHDPTAPCFIWLTIDKAFRQRGYGMQFYEYLLEHVDQARDITSHCMDDDPAFLSFAERYGFHVQRHAFISTLDLTQLDESQFSHLDKLRTQGIRITSLEVEGNTEANQRKLYDLEIETSRDNPGDRAEYGANFEEFKAKIIHAPWFRPDAQILAVEGDRFAGLCAVGFDPDGETAFNAYTGVDQAYRGRGIAQGLKIAAADFAWKQGAKLIATHNDSENASMLHVNNKLGYVRQRGTYHLHKSTV